MSERKLQLNPYEPKEAPFVLDTLCRAVARAESWSALVIRCEALANTLRIAKQIEEEAFRNDFSAAAAEQRQRSLDQLRDLGREIRESQNGENHETSNT